MMRNVIRMGANATWVAVGTYLTPLRSPSIPWVFWVLGLITVGLVLIGAQYLQRLGSSVTSFYLAAISSTVLGAATSTALYLKRKNSSDDNGSPRP